MLVKMYWIWNFNWIIREKLQFNINITFKEHSIQFMFWRNKITAAISRRLFMLIKSARRHDSRWRGREVLNGNCKYIKDSKKKRILLNSPRWSRHLQSWNFQNDTSRCSSLHRSTTWKRNSVVFQNYDHFDIIWSI